jgi:transcriptional regulator with XRE-family HTH domain
MSSDVVARTPLQDAVAEEIRSVLARKRMSASHLARLMGVTQPYLWRRMAGETSFDLTDLERIAAALDVPVLQLLPARERNAAVTYRYQSELEVTPVRTTSRRSRYAPDRPIDNRPTGRPTNNGRPQFRRAIPAA